MKKRILVFIFVFFLIFSWTITVFAEPLDYQIYINNIYDRPLVLSSESIDAGDSLIISDSIIFTFNRSSNNSYFPYRGFGFYNSSHTNFSGKTFLLTFTAYSSRDCLFSVDHFSNARFTITSTEQSFYLVSHFTQDVPDYVFFLNKDSINEEFSVVFRNINFIDITDFGSDYDFSSYGIDFNDFVRSGFYHIDGYFNPFIDFYRNIFGHLFDFFPFLTSTYSSPFVLTVFCLSICFMIFIIVFMIKKFTRGKC